MNDDVTQRGWFLLYFSFFSSCLMPYALCLMPHDRISIAPSSPFSFRRRDLVTQSETSKHYLGTYARYNICPSRLTKRKKNHTLFHLRYSCQTVEQKGP